MGSLMGTWIGRSARFFLMGNGEYGGDKAHAMARRNGWG